MATADIIQWNELAKNLLQVEMKKRRLTYALLEQKLKEVGIEESVNSLRSKISRGTFSCAFFLQVAKAIGIKNVRLDELLYTNEEC